VTKTARWLACWLNESHQAPIDTAAELAATLAELHVEPDESVEAIRRSL
jgi:hypothetical protein